MKIRFDKVSKTFGTVTALDDITLEIADGELFFLLGPSGCGKTTLLRCLAGFEEPTSGTIHLDDVDVRHQKPHQRNTAMVFQGYALWPHMTVAQNVAFGLEMQGVSPQERREKVQRALDTVQIGELADRKPNELSGGQQQRVALARTLVVEPGCLLLDEPLANLDAKLRRDMRTEIRRICKENHLTAVYVTHDRQEALSMADRIAVLKDGIVLQEGTPREIYRRPVSEFVAGFMGESNFLPATLQSTQGERAVLDTGFGPLGSMAVGPTVQIGDKVTVSLRPEAIALRTAEENSFSGILTATTYLGEIAEHRVRLEAGLDLKVFELNPRGNHPLGKSVSLSVDPADVVVLPHCDP